MLKLGIFLVFDDIFKATYWECGRRRGVLSLLLPLPLPMRRCPLLLPSKPVSHYSCKNLPKTDDNDRKHKNDANTLS